MEDAPLALSAPGGVSAGAGPEVVVMAPPAVAASVTPLDSEELAAMAAGDALFKQLEEEMKAKTPWGQAAEMILATGTCVDMCIERFLCTGPTKARILVTRSVVNPPPQDTSGRPLRSFEMTFRVLLLPRSALGSSTLPPTLTGEDKPYDKAYEDACHDAAFTAALAETDPTRVVGSTYRWPQDVGAGAGAGSGSGETRTKRGRV